MINDLTGRTFGRWTVLAFSGKAPRSHQTLWRCQCECGVIKNAVLYTALTRGASQSCGCLRTGSRLPDNEVHAQRNQLYSIWQSIKTRCFNQTHPTYPRYGGRGITLHTPWVTDFRAFAIHMGPRPTKVHTVERIDNNGNYAPGNLRWATRAEQNRNRRNNQTFSWKGQNHLLDDIARMEDVSYNSLYHMVVPSGDIEQAITTLRSKGLTYTCRRKQVIPEITQP